MNDIKGIPYSTVEFDKNGNIVGAEPTVAPDRTDLIVISHGWNNNHQEAEQMYSKLFGNFVDVTADDPAIARRKIAIVGVLWPSKKFNELMTQPGAAKAAGGAAAFGGADQDAAEAAMRAAIDLAAPLFDGAGGAAGLDKLRALIPGIEDNASAQEQFVEALRELLGPAGSDPAGQSEEDSADVFFLGSPGVIFNNAKQQPAPDPDAPAVADAGPGDDMGRAAGIGSFFSGALNAVTTLLNLTTYYEMKQRAGTIGKNGLAPLLDRLAAGDVARVHLIGHSFGGRLVTGAAANSTTRKLHSLSLLQAAFSHNGFSKSMDGFFRSVVDNQRIAGPILVTHTKNDKAVGLAYPAASRIAGQNASGFGDANDQYGGLGSNGAQRMGAGEVATGVTALLECGQAYQWQAGLFHNLESSPFIRDPDGGDAHGWIFVPQVAWAVSRAVVS